VGLKKIHHYNRKLLIARAFTGVDRWRGLPNNHLWDQAENLDSTPQVHLNNNAGKLSRLTAAARKYGGKYDMEANSKEGYTLVSLVESIGKTCALTNLANK
jgi:hypothetical protein